MARVGALAGLLRLRVCFQGARETGRGVTGELRSPEPAEKPAASRIARPPSCYNTPFNWRSLVAALRALMRVFSYLFHGLLALFLLAIALLALSSGQALQLDMLPWEGRTLTYWLLGAALVGLASVILAVWGKWRPLFFLWSLVVLAGIVRGFFLSHYHFAGPPEFHNALYLTGGALIAAFGAWFQLRPRSLNAR
jgi:hypothetical protein